jgi:hypothetical protein
MKLTTVLSATNNNPDYYLFIPMQIMFWGHFNIRFIAVFVGESMPIELEPYTDNIVLWPYNANLKSAYVAQNIRLYYPAILELPEDEMVMITDMDMLPMSLGYYANGLEQYTTRDFVYYRNIDQNHIYMCYNASHPTTWADLFGIRSISDVETRLNQYYDSHYNGIPGQTGWFTYQIVLYNTLIHYPHLHILERPIRRLEMNVYRNKMAQSNSPFIHMYDDAHFHRSYINNKELIWNTYSQLNG